MRAGRTEKIHTPPGQQQTGSPAHQREEKAFAKQLPNKTKAAGAQRGADSDLTAARRGARQKKIGHVRAGDQKHERHGTE